MSANVATLAGNPPLIFLSSCNQILKYTSGVKQFPASSKFRKIFFADPEFGTLLFVPGAVDILKEIGYSNTENAEFILLPVSCALFDLNRVHQELTEYSTQILAHFSASNVVPPGSALSVPLNPDPTGLSRVTTEISGKYCFNLTTYMIYLVNNCISSIKFTNNSAQKI